VAIEGATAASVAERAAAATPPGEVEARGGSLRRDVVLDTPGACLESSGRISSWCSAQSMSQQMIVAVPGRLKAARAEVGPGVGMRLYRRP